MIMISKFSNFPDKLSEIDELKEYELSGSDCTNTQASKKCSIVSISSSSRLTDYNYREQTCSCDLHYVIGKTIKYSPFDFDEITRKRSMVPTWPVEKGKAFSTQGKSGNFNKTGKVREDIKNV